MKKEIALKLKEMDKKHLEYVNNPKINEDDDLYNERMILLVHEKQSSWHLYYDPKYNYIYSIAVVPSAKSSCFGDLKYFKRWYRWKEENDKNAMLCLTNKAVELLGI